MTNAARKIDINVNNAQDAASKQLALSSSYIFISNFNLAIVAKVTASVNMVRKINVVLRLIE